MLPLALWGQNADVMPDVRAESWSAAVFTFKLNESLNFNLEEQLRFKSGGKLYDRSFTQLKIEHTFMDAFELGLGYRFIHLNDEEGNLQEMETHRRWNYYFSGKFKVDRFSSKTRIQFQSRKEMVAGNNFFVNKARRYWRLKTALLYNIKGWKLDPKAGIEFFMRPREHSKGQYNKYRLMLGTTWKLKGPHEIGFRYLFERELKGWNPSVVYALDLRYHYTLKYKSKKKHKDE